MIDQRLVILEIVFKGAFVQVSFEATRPFIPGYSLFSPFLHQHIDEHLKMSRGKVAGGSHRQAYYERAINNTSNASLFLITKL